MIITVSSPNASSRWILILLFGALVGMSANGQDIYDAGRLTDRAIAVRAAGDYEEAIRTLRLAVTAAPDQLQPRLLLAETLAWTKRFRESESEYRQALRRDPKSRNAQLGLAHVLLWQGRYEEARRLFLHLTEADKRDIDAAEGAATAAYWSGDYRTAQRELAEVLRRDPARTGARQSLNEIDAASRPIDRVDVDATDDDQPYRFVRATASTSLFTDPLTRWDATAGSWWMNARRSGMRANAPFFRAGNETTFPAQRIVVAASFGAIRHPDGTTRPIGSAAFSLRVSPRSAITAAVEQREMLATATAIDRHIYSRATSLQWRRQADHTWSASADVRQIHYSDANRGWAITGYALAPFAKVASISLSGGVSAAIRDTRETRFYVESISSARTGSAFDYSYRGAYTPYWTPRGFRELRGIVAADTELAGAHVRLQADGGFTRDRETNFGPDAGPTLLPSSIYALEFRRTYHPVHLLMTLSRNVSAGISIEAAIEHNATVFYKSNGIRASLVRRH